MQNSKTNLALSPSHPLPMSKKVFTHKQQLDIMDPLVIDLAAAGAEDESYVCMMNDLENGVKGKELDETSELKTIQGMLQELGVTELPDENRLIVINGVEILVPLKERQRILSTLHLDHTSDENMIRQTKGNIFWPKMHADLKKTYIECTQCTENRISKPQKDNENSFRNIFENFFPNQMIENYFAQKGAQDYIVVACSLTGFLQV